MSYEMLDTHYHHASLTTHNGGLNEVLVIGGGGREHALVWKLLQSPRVDKVYCAPGNAGISEIAECIDIKPDDIESLLDFVKYNWIDLTVVGPEVPLTDGVVDAL